MLVRRLLGFELLNIAGQDDARRHPMSQRNAECAIDHVAKLGRDRHHLDVFVGDILEERQQIDLLLKLASQGTARLLPADRHDWLVIGLGVVKARQQMNCSGPGCAEADADLIGELGMPAGHERRGFFVPRLNEPDRVAGTTEGAHHAIDAVTGITIDPRDAPRLQTLDQKVADGFHRRPFSAGRRDGRWTGRPTE